MVGAASQVFPGSERHDCSRRSAWRPSPQPEFARERDAAFLVPAVIAYVAEHPSNSRTVAPGGTVTTCGSLPFNTSLISTAPPTGQGRRPGVRDVPPAEHPIMPRRTARPRDRAPPAGAAMPVRQRRQEIGARRRNSQATGLSEPQRGDTSRVLRRGGPWAGPGRSRGPRSRGASRAATAWGPRAPAPQPGHG